MSQQLNTEQVRQLLNRSTAQLDQATLARLREARMQALERHAPAHSMALSGHGRHPHWQSILHHHRPLLWLAGLLLAFGLVSGIAYWQHAQQNSFNPADIPILTDDLPLQVYLD